MKASWLTSRTNDSQSWRGQTRNKCNFRRGFIFVAILPRTTKLNSLCIKNIHVLDVKLLIGHCLVHIHLSREIQPTHSLSHIEPSRRWLASAHYTPLSVIWNKWKIAFASNCSRSDFKEAQRKSDHCVYFAQYTWNSSQLKNAWQLIIASLSSRHAYIPYTTEKLVNAFIRIWIHLLEGAVTVLSSSVVVVSVVVVHYVNSVFQFYFDISVGFEWKLSACCWGFTLT